MIREKNVTICSCDRSALQQSAATVYFKTAYSKTDSFVSLFMEMEIIVTQKNGIRFGWNDTERASSGEPLPAAIKSGRGVFMPYQEP